MPVRILVADDEEKIARLVGDYLLAEGFEPVFAFDGAAALARFRELRPDCLILDIAMPGMNGLDVAREVRRVSSVPIIFLSARAEETDRVVGLELGADDYVTKPFSPRELVARVRAVLRRATPAASGATGAGTGAAGIAGAGRENGAGAAGGTAAGAGTILARGALRLDARRREVTVDGIVRPLTSLQFDILRLLMGEPGRVYGRAEILDACAGTTFEGYERTIDAHIKNIRKALGDDSDRPRFIATVRGVGYKLLETPDEA